MRKKRIVKAYQSSRTLTKIRPDKPHGKIFYSFVILGILLVTTLSTANIASLFKPPDIQTKTVLATSRDLKSERDFWITFLESSQDYLPAILELTKIEYELGQIDAARGFLAKAKLINPNDEKLKEVEKLFLR